MQRATNRIPYILVAGIISFAIFIRIGVKDIVTDIPTHAQMISTAVENNTFPVNFLYYLIVFMISGFSTDTIVLYYTSLLVLPFAVILKYHYSLKLTLFTEFNHLNSLEHNKQNILFLAILLLLIIHPIITPLDLDNGMYYLGKASINIWHNSTTIFVMPLVVILFFYSYIYLNQPDTKYLYFVLLTGFLIVLIKPSFLFCFLVAYSLLLFLKFKLSRKFMTGMFIVAVLGVFIVLEYFAVYYFNNYGKILSYNESSNIILAPFKAWMHYSENLFVDMVSSIAFPLFFSLVYFNILKKSLLLQYSWLLFITAFLFGILFLEDGPRRWHLNFLWQVPMANYLLFLTSTIIFLKILFQENNLRIKDGFLVFIWSGHLISGVIYLKKFLFMFDYK